MSAERAARGFFVTGTDTEVGKTFVTAALVRNLRKRGLTVAGCKPIECGGRDDARALLDAMGEGDATLDEINFLHFGEAVAPVSIPGAGEKIDLEALADSCRSLADRFGVVLVEGIGGWQAPLDGQRSMADLATRLGWPVLLVAANRIGVLNHARLTVDAIRASGNRCAGILLNTLPGASVEEDASVPRNLAALREMFPEIPVGEVDRGEIVGPEWDRWMAEWAEREG